MAEYQMNTNQEPPKKKSQRFKYLIYIVVVLVATAISLVISLWGDNFNDAMTAFSQSDWRYVLLTFGVVALTYCIEALIRHPGVEWGTGHAGLYDEEPGNLGF